jgi:AP2-like factor, ANT lineage
MSSSNGSNNGGSANNGGTTAAASGWLGFSLSPHMASSMDDQQQQQGLFFSSVSAAAYGLGAGDGAVAGSGGPYYTPQLASMPLKSDGSLCIMEALQRRTDQQDHHGGTCLFGLHALALCVFLDYYTLGGHIYTYIYIM